MAFLINFIREVTRPFYFNQYYNSTLRIGEMVTHDKNNVFSKSIIVDITKDDIEIPAITRAFYESLFQYTLIHTNIKIEKIILPLYTNSRDRNLRTFNGIIKEAFCDTNINLRLRKIITSKNEIYYVGFGIILDENYNPLLMNSIRSRKVVTEDDEGIKVPCMEYYRAICRVSPVVFTEPGKLINKGIIKKLIPLYTTTDTIFPSSNYNILSNPDSKKVEVIIDDFSKFFITPITPTPSEYINVTLNKCLNDNIEEVLALIQQ